MDRLLDLPKVSPPMNPSTIYITVVDKDRNVCSFINSIAHAFGSAIVSNKTGVLLQNRGGGFRIQPGHPNCIAPGKRPLHTIIPSLVTKDGRAKMPFGVMGGQYQPVGQVRVLTNILDYGCDLQEAIDMPRGLHYENIYQLEDGVPADDRRGPEEARAPDHQRGRAARRRPGDLDRLGQGHAHRRFRSAQGRLRARLLSDRPRKRILTLSKDAEKMRRFRFRSLPIALAVAIATVGVLALRRAIRRIGPDRRKNHDHTFRLADYRHHRRTGASPKPGQICVMHYTGWLYEGGKKGKKFDSSVDRNEPFEFPIGQQRVIAGWDEGVATMKVGGKRTLIIPPALGYGARGAGGVIPPNATLMFDVELLAVK